MSTFRIETVYGLKKVTSSVADPVAALKDLADRFDKLSLFTVTSAECWHSMDDGREVRQWRLEID